MKDLKKTFREKLSEKLRYGLLLQTLNNRFARTGIEIKPCYLTKEGITDIEPPAIKGEPSEYTFVTPGLDDLLPLTNRTDFYNMGIFNNFVKEGKICYGVMHKGEIISFLWVNFRECRHKSFVMPLKENEVYYSDMYTLEPYRGKNIAPYLRYHSMNELKKKGKDTFYSITEYFNTAARKYKKKLNAKHAKLFLQVTLFKKYQRNFTLRTYK